MLLRTGELTDEEKQTVELLCRLAPENADGLRAWLINAQRSGVAEFIAFANGLTTDLQAVRAALKYEWSQGQLEGQVHRLKLVKRQMYGRGKLDLLRARVLYAA